jgi:hypothetical protein
VGGRARGHEKEKKGGRGVGLGWASGHVACRGGAWGGVGSSREWRSRADVGGGETRAGNRGVQRVGGFGDGCWAAMGQSAWSCPR